MLPYADLLKMGMEAALEAGRSILTVYGLDDHEVEFKEDQSPLTLADKRSNDIIIRHLQPSQIPILSEESLNRPWDERKNWPACWIVDPLDGTKEFIKRNGEFTVNIALAEMGTPVIGIIYTPVTGELYFSTKESGAFKYIVSDVRQDREIFQTILNKAVRIPQLKTQELPFTVVASRSHLTPETAHFIEELRKDHPDLHIISRGSSLKICMVAEGIARVYPRFAPTMEWDTAAGQAIAEAAGCRMYIPDTREPLRYNKEELRNPWFVVEQR
jgi:3'(2'), 5'-bisphosphate nucleotidase